MTKYGEFIEAYKKAVPHIRKKLQYEQGNKIWNDLKKNWKKPEEFDQQFREKMQEFKLMEAGCNLKNLKTFQQSRLNFGKVKVPAETAPAPKGQLISKSSFSATESTKNPTKFL